MSSKAVFLDRDGVLIRDVHLLTRPEQVELFPCVPEALRRLDQAGFVMVVVTNQPVVARGLVSEAEVEAIHRFIARRLGELARPAPEAFYFCPHHPRATLARYRRACSCRKPAPGMLLQAAADLDLELARSFMIGDRMSDVAAGRFAGCRTVLLETGKHAEAPIESAVPMPPDLWPDHRCRDLGRALDWIFSTEERRA